MVYDSKAIGLERKSNKEKIIQETRRSEWYFTKEEEIFT